MFSKVKIKGTCSITFRGKTSVHRNLVVDLGLNKIAKRLGGVAANAVGYIAVGDDATAPAAGQTALIGTEHSRVATANSVTSNVLKLTATIGPFAANKLISELGIFDAASVGVMFSRVTPVPFTMEPADTIDVTWELEFE